MQDFFISKLYIFVYLRKGLDRLPSRSLSLSKISKTCQNFRSLKKWKILSPRFPVSICPLLGKILQKNKSNSSIQQEALTFTETTHILAQKRLKMRLFYAILNKPTLIIILIVYFNLYFAQFYLKRPRDASFHYFLVIWAVICL